MIFTSKDFRWSFSRISAYETCPKMFYLNYIEKKQDIDNAFAKFGTLGHTVLEKYAKGELLEFELEDEYERLYDTEMTLPFPPFPKGMAEKYYLAGKDYFANFDGFGDEWEILETEMQFECVIEGYTFTGFSDLILQHKETGDIMIVDHKSASVNTMKGQRKKYRHQLYIYAEYVKQKYGKYPAILRFNLFRDGEVMDEKFSEKHLQEMREWVVTNIEKIKDETQWPVQESSYFCQFICGVSQHCPAAMAKYK